jgi:hypothetical protein
VSNAFTKAAEWVALMEGYFTVLTFVASLHIVNGTLSVGKSGMDELASIITVDVEFISAVWTRKQISFKLHFYY